MKKISALLLTLIFLCGAAQSFAQTKAAAPPQSTDLIAQLPASDGVVQINMKRLMDDALPAVLAGNQPALSKITAQIDEIKAKTGIDARQFERVVVGMKFTHVRGAEVDIDPIVLAQGGFNAGAMIAAGRVAANGKYREERVAGKTVYVFSVKDAVSEAQKHLPADKNADKALKLGSRLLTGEIAAVAVNSNTLALGKPQQLRAMLAANGRNRISADLAGLVNKNPNAVVSFAGNVPLFTTSVLELGNDEFARLLGSLKQVFGSFDIAGGDLALALAARTDSPAQAEKLEEALQMVKMFGAGYLRSSSKDRNKVLADVVENLQIVRSSNEVQLNARLPQADLDKFMGGFDLKF